MSKEQIQDSPEEVQDQRERIVIQLAIIRSMIRRGIIKTAGDYIDNGHAAAFEMLWDGTLRCASDEEVEEISRKARELTGHRA